MTPIDEKAREIPAFIRPWTAPFHITMDGIKDANGCWVCTAPNQKTATELVELMNYAASAAADRANLEAATEARVRRECAGIAKGAWLLADIGTIADADAQAALCEYIEAKILASGDTTDAVSARTLSKEGRDNG